VFQPNQCGALLQSLLCPEWLPWSLFPVSGSLLPIRPSNRDHGSSLSGYLGTNLLCHLWHELCLSEELNQSQLSWGVHAAWWATSSLLRV